MVIKYVFRSPVVLLETYFANTNTEWVTIHKCTDKSMFYLPTRVLSRHESKTVPTTLTKLFNTSLSVNSFSCCKVVRRTQWPSSRRPVGLRVRILPGAWMPLTCGCCVLSGRDLCERPIPGPQVCYPLWCVTVWSRNLKTDRLADGRARRF